MRVRWPLAHEAVSMSSSSPRGSRPAVALRFAATAVALLGALVVLLLTPAISAGTAWRRARLRRRVRRQWADGPRLVLCVGAESADPAVGAQWARLAGPAVHWFDVTGGAGGVRLPPPPAEPARAAEDRALAEAVRREWGPDYKFLQPPAALIVEPSGEVAQVPLGDAVAAWRLSASGPLDAALERLRVRLGHAGPTTAT